ncbi:MAG: rhomboid family intramembrane serine protease [Actinomycetota bacterium]
MTDEAGPGAWSAVTPVIALVLAIVAVETVDSVLLDDRLQGNGIGPRRIEALDGVLWHPFLHSGFRHLSSNAIPLLVMGWLVALRGRTFWWAVTAGSVLIGGFLVWLFAGGFNHIGASGIVFGYFGALMGAAWKSRRPAALAPALVAIFLYGTILAGLLPLEGISWEGHLAGLIVGTAISMRLTAPPPPPPPDDEILYPWELDEPWRVDRDGDGEDGRQP